MQIDSSLAGFWWIQSISEGNNRRPPQRKQKVQVHIEEFAKLNSVAELKWKSWARVEDKIGDADSEESTRVELSVVVVGEVGGS